MPANRTVAHAILAFLAMPGVVAFAVPWVLRPRGARIGAAGVPLLVLGAGLLLWCVVDFHVAGRGTLAPWAPPERLVTRGPYRWSRNPMYVAVLLVLAGWALAWGGWVAWGYAAAVAIAFHLRVVLGEEPWLARQHGERWQAYSAQVPRWLGRVRGAPSGGERRAVR